MCLLTVSGTAQPIFCTQNREGRNNKASLWPVACSASNLHFILCDATQSRLVATKHQWSEWNHLFRAGTENWKAKLRKVAPYPPSSHYYPSSVMLFWACWKPGLPRRAAVILLQLLTWTFLLPDLLVGRSFSGFNCLTFWHIIYRADLYNHTGRECQLYEYSEITLLYSLFIKISSAPD